MDRDISFGSIVKEHRHSLDLTQAELARRVACATITIRKIEADSLRPSTQIAERLATSLKIPLEDRAAFVRLARTASLKTPTPQPLPTPPPTPEEIGLEDLSGRAVRGFELGDRMGEGGFGVVYRAIQPLVEREVAVKIILPRYADHPEFIRRFEAEAQLVARLEHPHIVPLYDYWREPGAAFLVMRLMRGGSLHSRLKEGPLTLDFILRFLNQVGGALFSAHRMGVIHRDLKPANILLDEDENTYLADFGVAKNLGSPEQTSDTMLAGIIGSPAYVSPEQIRAEPVRPQADIYALGVLLFELLTGRQPFPGPTPIDYAQQHLNQPTPPLLEYNPNLPPSLEPVLSRATAKSPEDRYPDIPNLVRDFQSALVSTGVEMPPAVVIEWLPEDQVDLEAIQNPYKGLRAFEEADAEDFFGRETLVQDLLGRLAEENDLSRFLAVVGPSGSGKSSAVKAGLIPSLRRGGLPGSEKWFIIEFTPGSHPFEELETALLRVAINPPESLIGQLRQDERGLLRAVGRILPPDKTVDLVLVVDQLEELFTLVENEDTRAAFLESLLTAILEPRSRLRVVITLRADFTDRPLEYVDFGELLRQRTEFVLPLTLDELELAIIQPACQSSLALEAGLCERIISDLGDQPGTLPLLQYTLTELFERRSERQLTLQAYQDSGGVLGSLGKRAEEIYSGLAVEIKETARQVFLRLVTLGEGVEDTRRRVQKSELDTLTSIPSPMYGREESGVREVLDSFGRARLLAFDRDPLTRGPTVEVAHEALLREWSRLREWLDQSRADIRNQRVLGNAATDWLEVECDPSFLLRGSRLNQFAAWAESTDLALTQTEQEYLKACLAERRTRETAEAERLAHEAALESRSRNFLRALVGVFAVAAIVAVVLSLYAFNQQRIAQDSAVTATVAQGQAQIEAATAVAAQEEAQLKAIAEAQAREEAEKSGRFSTSNELVTFTQAELNKPTDFTHSLSLLLARQAILTTLSADGYVTANAEANLRQAINSAPILVKTLAGQDDMIELASWSPDGKNVLTVGDRTRVWDAESGEELWVLNDRCGDILTAFWSPDGKKILSTSSGDCLITWDTQSREEELLLHDIGGTGEVYRRGFSIVPRMATWSPDGTKIATSIDQSFIVVDAQTGEQLLKKPIKGENNFAIFSPDGDKIVTNEDNLIIITNSLTGEGELLLENITSPATSLHWNQDGSRLLISSRLGFVTIQDSKTGEVLHEFPHTREVFSADWSSDESQIVTATGDGIVTIWDIQTENVVRQWQASRTPIWTVDWSPDGTYILTGDNDGFAQIWKIGLLDQIQHTFSVTSASWSPDGTRVLTASGIKAHIWDVNLGIELLRFEGHSSPILAVAWEPNGERVITGDGNGQAIIWNTENGDILLELGGHMGAHQGAIYSASWNPDGNLILTTGQDNTTRIWDAESGRKIQSFDGLKSGEWNPAGDLIVTTSPDGTAQIWDVRNGDELLELRDHKQMINDADWSPDGKYVITGSSDRTARVWNAQTGEKLSQLIGHTGVVLSVEWHPSAFQILTASTDGTARIWDAQTGVEVNRLLGHESAISEAAWSPDGNKILTGSLDNTACIWSVGIEGLLDLAESLIIRDPPEFTPEELCLYLHDCGE